MDSELDLIKKIEAYLFQELSEKEKLNFEDLRSTNPALDNKVVEHLNFLKNIKAYGEKKALKSQMDQIHAGLNLNDITHSVTETSSTIIDFWRRYKNNLAIAASVAIICTIITLLSTGQFNPNSHNTNYSALKRDMENIKKSQNALIRGYDVTSPNTKNNSQSQFGGSGFALTNTGYFVTNYHVVEGADSVYIQNNKGQSFKVNIIYIDPTYDIAILGIADSTFTKLAPLPYTFKKSVSDLGEEVYTIGYPRDEVVYGKGYLSSATGYGGDSTAYQVSIPVNPGNSGGPLLDNRGNVIGLIKGKQTQTDGAAFAIKSNFILQSVDNIPQDSLKTKLTITKQNNLAGLSRTQQIKKIEDFIFMIKVYNRD
ncbi:MAG: serine protease [Sphingobacteriales bacterium]|nr:MAG: serine protease [Sphingobacteriales bacterium]